MRSKDTFRLISIAGAFLAGFWLPLRMIGFQPTSTIEVIFDLFISTISLINLHLYFRDSKTSVQDVKNWLHVGPLLDLVCFLPLSLAAFLVFGATSEWLLLLNLLTVRHIRNIKPFLDRFSTLQPITYRLVPLVVVLPLIVHVVACGWIALGSGTAEAGETPLLTYVRAVYWTFSTLTTVGYGDIVARSIPQMIYACGVQVVGVGVFGFILSNVAGLLARSDAAREHHMDNLDRVETFMRLHATPGELRSKVRTYYHFMWTNKKGYQDDSLLNDLPAKIQAELFMHINRPILEKVEFLRGADPEFLGELMGELKPRVFIPDEKIFRAGDQGDALYFIQSGSVDIVGSGNEHIATLRDGSVFGEMALISEKPRAATAMARSYVDAFLLPREAFVRVMIKHPHFRSHLEAMVNARQAS